METKFNFKSQICTDKIQSERLLALGLKKETADMVHYISASMKEWGILATPWRDDFDGCKFYSPAWSLHRIISMVYSSRAKKNHLGLAIIEYENPFEDMIRQIEWLIKEGYFNKEYLEE